MAHIDCSSLYLRAMCMGQSDNSFKKTLCLMNIYPQDLLSHEPILWFRLWFINRTIFLGHKLPQSLWKMPFDLEVHLEAVYKL